MKSLDFLGTTIEGSSWNLGIAQQWSKQYQNYFIAPLLIEKLSNGIKNMAKGTMV
jgi:hypothetical protein